MKLSGLLVKTILGISLLISPAAFAADIVSVKGEATFYDDGTRSRVECKRLALEQARVDALAKKFGTIVSQDILQSDRVSGNREHNDFLSLSSTEVRGEWVADDGEPEYKIEYDNDDNMIVHCTVKGKAKAIDNESAQFNSQVLRNGTDSRNADINFKNGDAMYLDFQGSQDGYMTVFLEDEHRNVYQLLPYTTDEKTRIPVKKGTRYVFFSPSDAQKGEVVDELILTAENNTEYNRVYVLFSPAQFSPPVLNRNPGELPWMNTDAFTKWLLKTRKNDPKMGVKAMNLIIAPSN